MPKKTTTDDRSEQSKRFIDTAREIGTDESGEAFDRAFGKIVPPKHPKSKAKPEEKRKRK